MRPALLLLPLLACAPAPGPPDGGPGPDAGPPTFLDELASLEDYEGLVGESGAVKYLLPVDAADPQPPLEGCVFQDTAAFPFHLPWLNAQPGGEALTFDDYIALVLRREGRAWWGGELLFRPAQPHPLTGVEGTLLYTLYTEDSPGNRLVIDDVRAVDGILRGCAPFFAERLAFAPSSNEQRATAPVIAPTLANEGIAVIVP